MIQRWLQESIVFDCVGKLGVAGGHVVMQTRLQKGLSFIGVPGNETADHLEHKTRNLENRTSE